MSFVQRTHKERHQAEKTSARMCVLMHHSFGDKPELWIVVFDHEDASVSTAVARVSDGDAAFFTLVRKPFGRTILSVFKTISSKSMKRLRRVSSPR